MFKKLNKFQALSQNMPTLILQLKVSAQIDHNVYSPARPAWPSPLLLSEQPDLSPLASKLSSHPSSVSFGPYLNTHLNTSFESVAEFSYLASVDINI